MRWGNEQVIIEMWKDEERKTIGKFFFRVTGCFEKKIAQWPPKIAQNVANLCKFCQLWVN
jgi:hypothetical protein